MDLASIKPKDRVIEIKNPSTDEPVGVRVTLISMQDPRTALAKRRRQDTMNRLERNGRTAKAEDVEKINNEFLLGHMKEWEWYDAEFQGGKPDLTKENVLAVFAALPWFRAQIDGDLADDKAFFDA